MKFKEITVLCKNKNITMIELNKIDTSKFNVVKHIDDFFKISGNIIGYNTNIISSEDATNMQIEALYGMVSADFSEWLDLNYDKEIHKLCKQPEKENITLISIAGPYAWVQDSCLTEEEYNTLMKKIEGYREKFYAELNEKNERINKEIDTLISNYKEKYKTLRLVKEKDALITQLSGVLLTNYGIDGRSNPRYRKEMLKLYIESD